MSPQNGENGEQEQEEGEETDINEMAKRWRQSAQEKSSNGPDDHIEEPDTSDDVDGRRIDTDGLVVSYQARGQLYLPRTLQERLGSDDWDSKTKIPADYDAETHDLTIHFGSLVGDSA